MQRIDLDLQTPAELLAADEAVLDWCEGGNGSETLMFWEPPTEFVVVGYANKVDTEVNVAACNERGVPILRRCTGGGTVLQLPGGLNYSLILRITEDGPTRNISAANHFIMDRNRAAIQSALAGHGLTVAVCGHTDLAVASAEFPAKWLKVAGNSQRRRKHFLLFHGTFLLHCELPLIDTLLQMPNLKPVYRANREHHQFVTNLNLPVETVKAVLSQSWGANAISTNPPLKEIATLAREKYATHAWNYKF